MKPNFWKLSQGKDFCYADIIESIARGLVYVHKDTSAKGGAGTTQAHDFINAPIGDYFYLTHGNQGMFLIGQFSGSANLFSKYREGWLERPYKFIAPAISNQSYSGQNKWWSPQHNSTFTKIKDDEIGLFEQEILIPHFEIKLADYGIAI
jgi:hypothetical protein